MLRQRFAIGTYEVSLASENGYRGSARVKVDSLTPNDKVIEIVMRKR